MKTEQETVDAIVLWLRKRRDWLHKELMNGGTCDRERDQAEWLADAIEQGRWKDETDVPALPSASLGTQAEVTSVCRSNGMCGAINQAGTHACILPTEHTSPHGWET